MSDCEAGETNGKDSHEIECATNMAAEARQDTAPVTAVKAVANKIWPQPHKQIMVEMPTFEARGRISLEQGDHGCKALR